MNVLAHEISLLGEIALILVLRGERALPGPIGSLVVLVELVLPCA